MRQLFAVALCAACVACGGDSATSASVNIVGTYTLATANGAPLPYTFRAAEPRIELMSDRFIVNAAGGFTQSTVIRVTDEGVVTTQTLSDAGTYTIDGTTAAFVFGDGSIIAYTVETNRLTGTDLGVPVVYTKTP